jgi:hypothetical protein
VGDGSRGVPPQDPSSSVWSPHDPSSSRRPPHDPSSSRRPPHDPSSSRRPPHDPSSSRRPPHDPSSSRRPPHDPSSSIPALAHQLGSLACPDGTQSAREPPCPSPPISGVGRHAGHPGHRTATTPPLFSAGIPRSILATHGCTTAVRPAHQRDRPRPARAHHRSTGARPRHVEVLTRQARPQWTAGARERGRLRPARFRASSGREDPRRRARIRRRGAGIASQCRHPPRRRDPSTGVDVIVPRQRRVRLANVFVHRPTDRHDLEPVVRRGIPTTSPLRTLMDLGAVASVEDVAILLDHLVSGRLVTVEAVLDRLDLQTQAGSGRRGSARGSSRPGRSRVRQQTRTCLRGAGPRAPSAHAGPPPRGGGNRIRARLVLPRRCASSSNSTGSRDTSAYARSTRTGPATPS